MTGSTLLVVPIVAGEEGPFEAALDALPDAALSAIAPDGFAVFVGGGELALALFGVEDARAARERLESEGARPVLDLLTEHTAFASATLEGWLARDLAHVAEAAREQAAGESVP